MVKGKDFTIHGIAAVCVVLALSAFIISAALAALASFNWTYYVTAPRTLRAMLSSPHWQDSEATARNYTSQVNWRTLCSLRAGNNRKTDLFLASLVGQVVAIISIAVTVITII